MPFGPPAPPPPVTMPWFPAMPGGGDMGGGAGPGVPDMGATIGPPTPADAGLPLNAPLPQFAPPQEARFQAWYQPLAASNGIDANPDAPEHFYDYRRAYLAGAAPDETGHWPSQFKLPGHPRTYINGTDTRTGMPTGLDPAMAQILASLPQVQQPNFLQPPDPASAAYAPQGFLQNWAQQTGGQNPFAALQNWQPPPQVGTRNPWGDALAGFVGGLGGSLYNRGVQGVLGKQQAYNSALAGTDAENQQRKTTYSAAQSERAKTVEALLAHAATNRIDALTKPGAGGALDEYTVTAADVAKNPVLQPYLNKAVKSSFAERYGLVPKAPGVAEDEPLTPAARHMWALYAAATAKLPPLGMGAAAATDRRAILNEAAILRPKANLAMSAAQYRSDSGSLSNVQRMYDATSAFERTALANADNMLRLIKNVPDTSINWLNAPARAFAKGMGSADVAAFDAARLPVQNEFARILESPTLAGELSIQARKEMERIVQGSYTKAQMASAIKVLRFDANQRKTNYAAQLQEINDRMTMRSMAEQDRAGAGAQTGGSWFDQFGTQPGSK